MIKIGKRFSLTSCNVVQFPKSDANSYHVSHGIYLDTESMCLIKSSTRLLYPNSLSYHETSLTKLFVKAIPALASKMLLLASPTKSDDTTKSSVYPRMPLSSPSEAFLIVALISSYDASLPNLQVKSTTDTSMVGTRKDIPVSLPLSAGITLPTALAAPVEDGIIFAPAALSGKSTTCYDKGGCVFYSYLPPRQSLRDGPSTVG